MLTAPPREPPQQTQKHWVAHALYHSRPEYERGIIMKIYTHELEIRAEHGTFTELHGSYDAARASARFEHPSSIIVITELLPGKFVYSSGQGWQGIDYVSESVGMTVFLRPDTDHGIIDCQNMMERIKNMSNADKIALVSGRPTGKEAIT